MIDDFVDTFFVFIIGSLFLLLMLILILGIIEIVKDNNLYQYECVTIDNETITCDRVNKTQSGIIGTRDDTSYLIKQYKKIKKEVE